MSNTSNKRWRTTRLTRWLLLIILFLVMIVIICHDSIGLQ